MLSKLAVLCCALMFYSCASSNPFIFPFFADPPPLSAEAPVEPEEAIIEIEETKSSQFGPPGYWLSLPQPGKLIFIGVTGTQLKREAEIAAAREDAAKKVSMYHGVRAVAEHVHSAGSGFLDYYANSAVSVEYDQGFEKYLDKLAYDPESDVLKFDNVICIRFSYPENFPGEINYSFARNQSGRPEWTTRPPQEINGMNAGVGFSRRQSRMRDTIAKSYESAAADLVSGMSATVDSKVTSAGNQNSSSFHHASEGQLSHFMVIETWIEPDTQAVWTLAIAQASEIKE